jgi:hypothetical protein
MLAPPKTPIRSRLTRHEWRSLIGMAGFIVALHIIGWFTLLAIIAPEQYDVGGQIFGIGLGVTAYTLGMRHAFDADHIAAIDNTTRKLMADRQRRCRSASGSPSDIPSSCSGLCLLLRWACVRWPARWRRLVRCSRSPADRHRRLRRLPLLIGMHQPRAAGRHRRRCSAGCAGHFDEAAARGSSSTAAAS